MFKFCLYCIAFVFVVLRRSWFSSKFYLHCQHSITSSDLHYSVENDVLIMFVNVVFKIRTTSSPLHILVEVVFYRFRDISGPLLQGFHS